MLYLMSLISALPPLMPDEPLKKYGKKRYNFKIYHGCGLNLLTHIRVAAFCNLQAPKGYRDVLKYLNNLRYFSIHDS